MVRSENEKNFRQQYYQRVGFQGVDETKTLERILNEPNGGNPISIDNLKQFALKFSLPVSYQLRVWKVIAGIEPVFNRRFETFADIHKRSYEDTYLNKSACDLILPSQPESRNMAVIYISDEQLRQNRTRTYAYVFETEPRVYHFMAISESVMLMASSEPVHYQYALARAITNRLNKDVNSEVIEATAKFCLRKLKISESTAELYKHLSSIGLIECLPIQLWCCRGFAGVLHESGLQKIWDKVIAGAVKVLAYVAFALIEASEKSLRQCQTAEEGLKCFTSSSSDAQDSDSRIASNGIEYWIRDGAQLLPSQSKSESRQSNPISSSSIAEAEAKSAESSSSIKGRRA